MSCPSNEILAPFGIEPPLAVELLGERDPRWCFEPTTVYGLRIESPAARSAPANSRGVVVMHGVRE